MSKTKKARTAKELVERREMFKHIALTLLRSRPAGVLTGSENGAILCPRFLEDIELITESILKATQTFEEK